MAQPDVTMFDDPFAAPQERPSQGQADSTFAAEIGVGAGPAERSMGGSDPFDVTMDTSPKPVAQKTVEGNTVQPVPSASTTGGQKASASKPEQLVSEPAKPSVPTFDYITSWSHEQEPAIVSPSQPIAAASVVGRPTSPAQPLTQKDVRQDEAVIPDVMRPVVDKIHADIVKLPDDSTLEAIRQQVNNHVSQNWRDGMQLLGNVNGHPVYAVNGDTINKNLHMDFVDGDNGAHNAKNADGAIPDLGKNEIIVDSQESVARMRRIIVHEATEMYQMERGSPYERAHPIANAAEREFFNQEGGERSAGEQFAAAVGTADVSPLSASEQHNIARGIEEQAAGENIKNFFAENDRQRGVMQKMWDEQKKQLTPEMIRAAGDNPDDPSVVARWTDLAAEAAKHNFVVSEAERQSKYGTARGESEQEQRIQKRNRDEVDEYYKDKPIVGRARDLMVGFWDSLTEGFPRSTIGYVKAIDDLSNHIAHKSLQAKGVIEDGSERPASELYDLGGALKEMRQDQPVAAKSEFAMGVGRFAGGTANVIVVGMPYIVVNTVANAQEHLDNLKSQGMSEDEAYKFAAGYFAIDSISQIIAMKLGPGAAAHALSEKVVGSIPPSELIKIGKQALPQWRRETMVWGAQGAVQAGGTAALERLSGENPNADIVGEAAKGALGGTAGGALFGAGRAAEMFAAGREGKSQHDQFENNIKMFTAPKFMQETLDMMVREHEKAFPGNPRAGKVLIPGVEGEKIPTRASQEPTGKVPQDLGLTDPFAMTQEPQVEPAKLVVSRTRQDVNPETHPVGHIVAREGGIRPTEDTGAIPPRYVGHVAMDVMLQRVQSEIPNIDTVEKLRSALEGEGQKVSEKQHAEREAGSQLQDLKAKSEQVPLNVLKEGDLVLSSENGEPAKRHEVLSVSKDNVSIESGKWKNRLDYLDGTHISREDPLYDIAKKEYKAQESKAAAEAAKPSESGTPPELRAGEERDPNQVSIANAVLEDIRSAAGIKPGESREEKPDTQLFEAARKKDAENPNYGKNLVSEISASGRPHSDEEAVSLGIELSKAKKSFEEAYAAEQAIKASGDSIGAFAAAQKTIEAQQYLERVADVARESSSEAGAALRSCRFLIKDDYSFAGLVGRFARANGHSADGKELEALKVRSQELLTKLTAARDEIDANRRAADAAREKSVNEAVEKVRAEILGTKESWVWKQAHEMVDRWKKDADAAEKELLAMGGQATSLVDPVRLVLVGRLARGFIGENGLKFAEWSSQMIARHGEFIRPYLQEAWDGATRQVKQAVQKTFGNKAEVVEGGIVAPRVKSESGREKSPDELRKHAVELIAKKVENGQLDLGNQIKDIVRSVVAGDPKMETQQVWEKSHEIVKELVPQMSLRDMKDAFDGYGKWRPLTKGEVDTRMRTLRQEGQLESKIEDLKGGTPPKHTGGERQKLSDRARRLTTEVNELKKLMPVDSNDPRFLASVQQTIGRALQHRISDLQKAIDENAKLPSKTPRDPSKDTDVNKALRARKEALQAQYDSLFPKEATTPEQRLSIAKAAARRSIEDIDRQINDIANGKDPEANRRQGVTPDEELANLKAERKMRRAVLDSMLEDSGAKEKAWNLALQARRDKQILEYNRRAREQDFVRPGRVDRYKMDEFSQEKQVELERAKLEFQKEEAGWKSKNRDPFTKFVESFPSWSRFIVLHSLNIIPKLTSAAAELQVAYPLEQLVGSITRLPLQAIAEKAPRHGGAISIDAEIRAKASVWKNWLSDMRDIYKTGKTPIDAMFGKEHVESPSWMDYIGRFHYMLKSPAKRDEFVRSYEMRLQHAKNMGEDINSPDVQHEVASAAYQDALAMIFMEDNALDKKWKQVLMERDAKKGIAADSLEKAMSIGFRVAMPVVKVPTNIVLRTLEYALGSLAGSARLARMTYRGSLNEAGNEIETTNLATAWARGIDRLQPAEAEAIMRNFKRGALGTGFMLAGYFMPNTFGGYYQKGEKRGDDEAQFGGMRVGGHNVPRFLIHNPLLEMFQIGATIRRVSDGINKKTGENKGWVKGVGAAAAGVAEEIPYVQAMVKSAKSLESHDPEKIIGESLQTWIPQPIQSLARQTDKNTYFSMTEDATKRAPERLWEYPMVAIPGLREKVPEKQTNTPEEQTTRVGRPKSHHKSKAEGGIL